MNIYSWILILLTVLFVGLQVTGLVSWPWWLVLLPVWGPIALGVTAIVFMFTIALIGR